MVSLVLSTKGTIERRKTDFRRKMTEFLLSPKYLRADPEAYEHELAFILTTLRSSQPSILLQIERLLTTATQIPATSSMTLEIVGIVLVVALLGDLHSAKWREIKQLVCHE